MLIESPRHSVHDLRVWRERERIDAEWSKLNGFKRRVEKAREHIRRFVETGPCYVSVSWGKDSVVIAHLAVDLHLPIVWIRVESFFNPDCLTVRDIFLERFGCRDRYSEIAMQANVWLETGTQKEGFKKAENIAPRSIRGIRAQESGTRTLSAAVHGVATKNVCRPILHWSADDVFAYLYAYDLPVHPAYAMSCDGAIGREWLRVAPIVGKRGNGKARAEWERRYYPEIVRRAECGSGNQSTETS